MTRIYQMTWLALVYALFGWLSLQLAVPPGYAAPIFPSAGIALSALLIFGVRVWPAVLLGSFVLQLSNGLSAGMEPVMSWAAFVIPVGASLQALAGAKLAQRLIGFPNPLDAPAPILRFLVVVAPLSSLISPTIAMLVLTSVGLVRTDELLFNWWNWWIGDTLGVMVAAPLMFALFAQPRADWVGRRIGVVVPMMVAIVLLGLAIVQVRVWEANRVNAQFARDAEHVSSIVRKRLEVQLDMMFSIESMIVVNESISRAAFRNFVAPWLQRYPGTQNFGWSPLVLHAQREQFEREARARLSPSFRILGRDAEGNTFPAPEAEEYLPITYVEPFKGNERAFGLNTLHFPATAEAIVESRRTGQPVTSGGFRLVQEQGDQLGVVVYLPVLIESPELASMPRRVAGVISGVFRMDDSIAAARELADEMGITLCLIDTHGAPGNQRLSGPPGCDQATKSRSGLRTSVELPFASRNWRLDIEPGRSYVDAQRSWAAWVSIAVGLISVGMLGAFLLITSGNTRRITALVTRRTEQLAQAGEQLRVQQAALDEAQRLARMGSWQLDSESGSLLVSRELLSLLSSEAAGLTSLEALIQRVAPASRTHLREALEQVRSNGGVIALDCQLAADPARVLAFEIEGESNGTWVRRLRGTVQDVSRQREAEAHIQYLAHFDTLTGLPNRSAWIDQARHVLAAAKRYDEPFAVLFLDLDNFKNVNDTLGHPIGDQLLTSIARRLGHCIRLDDILARLGGDEFVALLPRLNDASMAANVAGKLLEVLSQPLVIEGHELLPSVSIGISIYPQDGEDIDTLLKHADTAMYGAKSAGRNNYQFFVPEMNQRAHQRMQLESALRHAIEREQLVLHYQPQFDAQSKRLCGLEALVRWQHPERGLVPPAEFIQVAEDSGLIIELGRWVLRAACLQLVQWQDSALRDISVAVNISPLQFRRSDWLDTVSQVLRETGADAHKLEFEITESVLMRPSKELTRTLSNLRAWGIQLSLDDFGTGYSSLAYIKRLPISMLKIDASFVRDVPGNPEDEAVTAAILSLARDLSLRVVAEGVETEAQQEFLVRRGCHMLQGFLLARPMTARHVLEQTVAQGW